MVPLVACAQAVPAAPQASKPMARGSALRLKTSLRYGERRDLPFMYALHCGETPGAAAWGPSGPVVSSHRVRSEGLRNPVGRSRRHALVSQSMTPRHGWFACRLRQQRGGRVERGPGVPEHGGVAAWMRRADVSWTKPVPCCDAHRADVLHAHSASPSVVRGKRKPPMNNLARAITEGYACHSALEIFLSRRSIRHSRIAFAHRGNA